MAQESIKTTPRSAGVGAAPSGGSSTAAPLGGSSTAAPSPENRAPPADWPVNPEQQKLLPPHERLTRPPRWFEAALAQAPQTCHASYRQRRVAYRRWRGADASRPTIVLVHGNGAHARWFDFIAPLLAPWPVLAVDLPGMGDSDWQENYSREHFADALGAVLAHAKLAPPPILVAHSFGSLVSIFTAQRFAAMVGGLLICDFLIRPPAHHVEWFEDWTEPRPARLYPERAHALARFRLQPPQPCGNEFLVSYIAAHSLREVRRGDNPGRAPSPAAGWSWKFDPNLWVRFVLGQDVGDVFAQLRCPIALMYGRASMDYQPEMIAHMAGLRPEPPPISIIAGAHHHIMLDQPHAFAASVLTQLENWRASMR